MKRSDFYNNLPIFLWGALLIYLVNGNLQAYKLHIRPYVRKKFGTHYFRNGNLSKNQINIQSILETLTLNGTQSTWEIAKKFHDQKSGIRTRDKKIRQLLMGRNEGVNKWPGLFKIRKSSCSGFPYIRF